MSNLLISVIVPCYNQGAFLDDCLSSIYNQTYSNWECIVVDDGSTDNTVAVANTWVNKDSRFRLISKKNGGLSSARNVGLEYCKGDFIQLLDSDDVIDLEKFDIQIKNIVQDKVDIDVADFILYDAINSRYKSQYLSPFPVSNMYLDELIIHWENKLSIPCHCVLFNKKLITDNFLKFDETLPNHEDWVFWVKLFYHAKSIGTTRIPLAIYRNHGNNMSLDIAAMNSGFLQAAQQLKNYFGSKQEKVCKNLVKKKIRLIEKKSQGDTLFFRAVNRVLGWFNYKLVHHLER